MPRDMNRYENNVLRDDIIKRIVLRKNKHYDYAAGMAMEAIRLTPVTKKLNPSLLAKTKAAVIMYDSESAICDEIIELINAIWPKEDK